MKKLFAAALATLLFTGCISHNSNGLCVGVVDQKKPGVEYEISTWNLVVAFIFSETIIVPVVVVAKELECPRL